MDTRVKLNLNKLRKPEDTSSDEDINEKGKLIQEKIHDFAKPIIIDFKDLDPSDIDEEDEEDESEEEQQDEIERDEDLSKTRKSFQQQKNISVDSRKR